MTINKINAETMRKAYDENYQTFLKKNTDYGSSFEESLNEFGEVAGIVRISDKYRRLVNITKNENKVLESKIDTFKDMANYCLMLAVWLEEFCREKEAEWWNNIEFYDTKTDGFVSAVDALNKFVAENESLKVSVVGYRVVRYEQLNKERTYILVEVEE